MKQPRSASYIHHRPNATMDSALTQQTLHPVLSFVIPSRLVASGSCTPNVLVHLPPSIFFDPYTSHELDRNSAVKAASVLGVLELEQPVGWSGRKSDSQSRSWWELPYEGEGAPLDSSAADEHTSVLISLEPVASTSAMEIKVPLHVRYSPPLPSEPMSFVESAEELLHQIAPSLASAAQSLLVKFTGKQQRKEKSPRRKERYYTQRLEKPQLFLTCDGRNKPSSGWYETEERNLFPSTHGHLSLPASRQAIYKPLVSSSSSATPLTLSLPRPSSDLAPLVQFSTISTVLLLTAWILTTLFASTSRVSSSEKKQQLRSLTKNE